LLVRSRFVDRGRADRGFDRGCFRGDASAYGGPDATRECARARCACPAMWREAPDASRLQGDNPV